MSRLYVAKSQNLSVAWTEVFLHLMDRGVAELAPAVITITDFDERFLPRQIPEIHQAIDTVNGQSCRTVASTIFPNSHGNLRLTTTPSGSICGMGGYGRQLPGARQIAKAFTFEDSPLTAQKMGDQEYTPVNQLAHIIQTYGRGNHRHSALQAAIFDPTRDHSHNRQRGFPCLQQVAFNPSDGNLEVTGFYALQHHVPKAYGNYLGLCWLGRFMARQMGLQLSQVTCVASSLKLLSGDGYSKSGLTPLKQTLEHILQRHDMRDT